MLNWHIRPVHILGVVASIASLGLFAPSANSQTGRELASGVDVQRLLSRIATLEHRLADVESRLQAVEQSDKTPHATPPSKRATAPEIRTHRDECASPSYVDQAGVRRVRSECLQAVPAESCSPPFLVDPDGIKRVKADCL